MLYPRIYNYVDMMRLMTLPHDIAIRGYVIRGYESFGVMAFRVMECGVLG